MGAKRHGRVKYLFSFFCVHVCRPFHFRFECCMFILNFMFSRHLFAFMCLVGIFIPLILFWQHSTVHLNAAARSSRNRSLALLAHSLVPLLRPLLAHGGFWRRSATSSSFSASSSSSYSSSSVSTSASSSSSLSSSLPHGPLQPSVTAMRLTHAEIVSAADAARTAVYSIARVCECDAAIGWAALSQVRGWMGCQSTCRAPEYREYLLYSFIIEFRLENKIRIVRAIFSIENNAKSAYSFTPHNSRLVHTHLTFLSVPRGCGRFS